IRVENLPNGQVRARGKAWAATDAEPAEWMIDKTAPIGNHEGAPGLFINAPFGAYLDNFSLSKNQYPLQTVNEPDLVSHLGAFMRVDPRDLPCCCSCSR